MRTLHEAMLEEAGNGPEQILRGLLAEKLQAQGIEPSSSQLDRLLSAMKHAESDSVSLTGGRWWNHQEILIAFTDEDMEELERRWSRFTDKIPEIYAELMDEFTSSALAYLKANWRREQRARKRDQAVFERRLLRHWGPAIGRLELLLAISQEFGADINAELRSSTLSEPYKVDVLIRLHARSCQVVKEIVVLLRSGLADGAMARWRTLHEIAVIAFYISDGDEDLAERYVLHDTMESKRAARDYADCYERLGYDPLEPGELEALNQECQKLKVRFGGAYGNPYGWAADRLGKDNPRFRDIENAVGVDHLRAHYRMASHNVHANPKGVFYKLGLIGEDDILLSGSSNAGLTDPGHGAAISLAQVCSTLVSFDPTFDNIAAVKVMEHLVDEIGEMFGEAHQLMADSV